MTGLRASQTRSAHTTNYPSLELVELALAQAQLSAGRRDVARRTLERALTESFALYHARMLLAELALQDGDSAVAADHWTAVAEMGAHDPVAMARYARYLVRAGRLADAEIAFRRVVEAEPHWVVVRRELAVALDSAGAPRRAEAIAAYEAYLARAPREPEGPRELALARVEQLRRR